MSSSRNGNKQNVLWNLFTSVKLTLGLLIVLAATSIFGTVIPQQEGAMELARQLSPGLVRILSSLQLFDMYHSLWFRLIIGILTLNLIICSLDRFPSAWKRFRSVPKLDRSKPLDHVPPQRSWSTTGKREQVLSLLAGVLRTRYKRVYQKETDNEVVLYAEKGRFSHLGVYLVHLSVLQEGEFEPLGSAKTVKVDVRVVAATNRDLRQMTADGKFREDLYFRLNVFPIYLPALRERGRDVELLASEFAKRFAKRMGKRVEPLAPDQLQLLRSYDWPGNVRELQNVIERAIILTSGSRLQLERAMAGTAVAKPDSASAVATAPDRILGVEEMLELERANILRALTATNGKVSGEDGAARLLGIPPTTLSSRMKALKIKKSSLRS